MQHTPKGILPVAASSVTGTASEMKGLKKVPRGAGFLEHLPCPDNPHSPPSHPCLNPEHSTPKHRAAAGWELQHLHSNWGCHSPHVTNFASVRQTRPAPLTDRLLAAVHSLRSSLMANPPSLLRQERCSPNNTAPAAPLPRPARGWSAGTVTGKPCTSQSGLVFCIFLSIAQKHRSPSTLALSYFQNAWWCHSGFCSHC